MAAKKTALALKWHTSLKKAVLTISNNAIASLKGQLSEKQFQLIEDKLVGQPFNLLDLLLLKLAKQDKDGEVKEDETGIIKTALFTDEDLEKVRHSLELYLNTLYKIRRVTPSLNKIHEIKTEIIELKKSLENLLVEEQESVQKEITKRETQLKKYLNSFNTTAHKFNLEGINFEKLPSMLNDLGYEDSFYEVVHAELSKYIGLIKKVNTAASIMDSLAEVTKSISHTEKELKATSAKEKKAAIAEKLKVLIKRKKSLQHDFTLTATGIDSTLDKKSAQEINVEKEMNKIFSPLIVGLTEFTEPSRRIEFLRSDILYHQQHLPKIQQGIEQINRLIQETQDNKVKAKLLKEKKYWVQQEKEISAKLGVAEQQLMDLLNRKLSPMDAFDQFIQAVFSERGLNILFALLIFFVSFIVLMLLRRLIMLINPFNYIPKLRFLGSLLDILLYLLAFVVAILALLVSLYVAGEVLALAIVVVMLLGIAWTLRNSLPLFVEQIKLLLGYGPVREGELVNYNGILWKVESIGIYSYLKNHLLTGNTLRLPIRDLIDLRSRPYDENKEELFPCKGGDYIVFVETKVWRKIETITPNRVNFDWFGAPESMPTNVFLKQRILNLSVAPFWVGINMQIDYQHRHEILNDIVGKLEAFIAEKFKALPFGDKFISPWVDMASIDDTFINVMVWVQMKPEADEKYMAIKMNLHKICLRAANEYGWEIKRFYAIEQHQPKIASEPLLNAE